MSQEDEGSSLGGLTVSTDGVSVTLTGTIAGNKFALNFTPYNAERLAAQLHAFADFCDRRAPKEKVEP